MEKTSLLSIADLEEKARQIRCDIIRLLAESGSGHPGGSLSSTDIVTALYFRVMRHNPSEPNWPERDRFHMSKGHCCPLWYSALAEAGYFPKEQLMTFRRFKGLQGHPSLAHHTPGIEMTAGSLGMGLGFGIGAALAARIDNRNYRTYILLGCGEINSGIIWEGAMAAGHWKLDNLCAILDYNRLQSEGPTEEIMNLEPVRDKWAAFNWHVVEIDGHNMQQIIDGFDETKATKGKPTIIIAHTIKGKGVSFMENNNAFHGSPPNAEQAMQALSELGGIE